MKDVEYWIEKLALTPHPEGGYFRETYRAKESLNVLPERYQGHRAISTLIYFLLKGEQVSHFHRLQSDEVWHFYTGSSLTLHLLAENEGYQTLKLGPDFESGQSFQAVVPAGVWFGATVDNPQSYTLVGCTVAPGFDFTDFEMGQYATLLQRFPEQQTLLSRLSLQSE